ncbi:RluA family pseudouridine synthase [Fredinandcohnia sp. 179-A 10B2 NHS]|uniref:RluA family pseudouridine synthase n=1 Tax=Fredinandcohnia sp. 179-A 10B2 NHS TaxID=3235176 RepID=UPI0039A10E7A
MTPFTLEWEITNNDEGKLVREFLKENAISKTALTDIKFAGGGIFCNNEPINVRHILNEGDMLKVVFPPEEPSKDLKAENIHLNIVYEDPYVIVVNKPSNQQSIPSRDKPSGSLANALLYYYQTTGLGTTVHLVNRLDKDTSGLLLVANHRHVHHLLSQQQKDGTLKRSYEAIVHGLLQEKIGTINAPIGRRDDSIIERQVREDGQKAITHYQVHHANKDWTHVYLQLETGRTHQIRVHLSYLGHPIAGDDLYGGDRSFINRQALHCRMLTFWHPIFEKEVTFYAGLPSDMMELLHKINLYL